MNVIGWIGSLFSGWFISLALWFADKAVAGVINGTLDNAAQDKIATWIDAKVDAVQKAAGETGAAVRADLVELCDKTKAKLLAP